MLQLKKITKDFGARRLFCGIDWHIRRSDRIGLCGENGAGKTTLLKILAGMISPDDGEVQFPRGATFGYLPQDGLEHSGHTLFEEARSAFEDLLEIEEELRRLEHSIAELPDEEALSRYATLQEMFRQRDGYLMEAEVGRVLHGLGFSEGDLEKPCSHFSGGWQMRIALAKLLLRKPDLLLLDEPTNHLDLPARDWLEDYLHGYPSSVVLVSHDRFFLDKVVGKIVEVWNGELSEYPGNYSTYLREREQRIAALKEAKVRQDEEIGRIEAFVQRFRYQANKASLVQSRVKQLEKIEPIRIPPSRKRIAFRFPPPPKGGKKLLELSGIEHGYGDLSVLNGVNLTVERGERIALVGANGAGKSTLMRLLAGVEGPRRGCRIEGHNLVAAYFAQDQARILNPEWNVLEEITRAAPFDMVPKVRDILGSFLFSGDDVHKKTAVLSGGERNRLALAILLLRPANLLLLDEPTNHLDLQSKDVLLHSLKGYSGSLVFVSHDRYFVDALANRVIAVGDGGIESHPGNYEDFLRSRVAKGETGHSELRVEQVAVKAPAGAETGGEGERLSYEERKETKKLERRRQKELEEVETTIEKLEGELSDLEREMSDPALYQDGARARTFSLRHQEIQEQIADLYVKWENLNLADTA